MNEHLDFDPAHLEGPAKADGSDESDLEYSSDSDSGNSDFTSATPVPTVSFTLSICQLG